MHVTDNIDGAECTMLRRGEYSRGIFFVVAIGIVGTILGGFRIVIEELRQRGAVGV
jgi:uncharacterized membrane protein YeaQ/YmgE (transglycosylase-associated protein family)